MTNIWNGWPYARTVCSRSSLFALVIFYSDANSVEMFINLGNLILLY